MFKFLNMPFGKKVPQGDIPYHRFWRAILDQGLKDLLNRGRSTEVKRAREGTIRWFNGRKTVNEETLGCNPGFIDVCGLADLKPAWVHHKMESILEEKGIKLVDCS